MNWFIRELQSLRPEEVRFLRQTEGLPYRLAVMIPEDEEAWPYAIVARLYALRFPRREGHVSIPQLMWQFDQDNPSGIWERRFVKMLDAGNLAPDQLYHELRTTVRFADQQNIAIDWSRLLADLVAIAADDPSRSLARAWASEFWLPPSERTEDDREMTIPEIVARYNLNPHYGAMLRRIAGTDRLPARREGRPWLIKRSAIERWLAEKPKPGPRPAS